MKKQMKSGITLIALVITVIILLILAGVIINLIIGENGIIRKAQEAGRNYQNAAEYEKIALDELMNTADSIIDEGTNNNKEPYDESEFRKLIAQAITNEGVETILEDSDATFVENIGKILQVRTKDATATADDITEGKTAWVNGELITGNGTNGIKMLSVMYNHEIDVETTTYVDQPTNGTYWHSSVSGNKKDWKYGTKSESQTNLIPLYKIDEKGKVYLLYSIDYYRNVSCTDHAGYFTGGLTVYLYDANGNEITSSSFGRCAVNQTHTNVKETFNLFEYIINTEAIYISFMLRCGGRESSDGPAVWSAGIVNKVDLTYYTAKTE